MITVEEAQTMIAEAIPVGPITAVPLDRAVGHVLARDVMAPISLPIFASSAMDGFAVRSADTSNASEHEAVTLQVIETIVAGTPPRTTVRAGQAARIMTGAMIPDGADAVIPIENVAECSDTAITLTQHATPKAHIRQAGEEVRCGAQALPQGSPLRPGAVGFLASLGIDHVPVYAAPSIGIIATGSELISPGRSLGPGQIYESNAVTLQAALRELHVSPKVYPTVVDDADLLRSTLRAALAAHDIVLLTGGVSVGDYDFVKDCLGELGVENMFWRVAQKPGKPLYFGKHESTWIFGLPGNPASSLSCYYEYVHQAVRQWLGHRSTQLPQSSAILQHDYHKKAGRAHFVRAHVETQGNERVVTALNVQGSHCMQSFAQANCFIYAPADATTLSAGSRVVTHQLSTEAV